VVAGAVAVSTRLPRDAAGAGAVVGVVEQLGLVADKRVDVASVPSVSVAVVFVVVGDVGAGVVAVVLLSCLIYFFSSN